MLATMSDKPFDSPDFVFEVKWDGVRTLAFCEKDRTRVFARSGRDVTHQYPEFASVHEHLKATEAVFDGEIVAMDENGRPSFERLQSRINLQRAGDIRRGVAQIPLELVLFDLVFVDGEWIGGRPLTGRVEHLKESFEFGDTILLSEGIPEQGTALFNAAGARGLEGIVAKKATSHYIPGKRTRDWIKIKVIKQMLVVIAGWTVGGGSRSSSFGSLIAGVYTKEGLTYIGNVGTGFNDRMLDVLVPKLKGLEIPKSALKDPPRLKGARWAKPELVAEVEYRELTNAFRLRAPSFKRIRDDIPAAQCTGRGVAGTP